jgi:hypothetical protein
MNLAETDTFRIWEKVGCYSLSMEIDLDIYHN